MKTTITKRYVRRLSYNYNSEEFATEEVREIEYNTKEEYLAEHEKLAAQVKALTQRDLEKNSELLKEALVNGDAVKDTGGTV